ncbi:MAG: cupin domain-containing protein [Devosia sp.]
MLIESPPQGMRMVPKHYHMLNEEHALILEGELTQLFGDERFQMTAGDYIAFPAGQEIGHSFWNRSAGPCRYLMIGENNTSDVCVMPDSNKMQVRALHTERSIFDMVAVRDYLDGEKAIN